MSYFHYIFVTFSSYLCPFHDEILSTIFILFSTWLLLLLLAQVTYNQVQPLQINYLATEFLELHGYIHHSIDSVQHKNCINSWAISITWHVSYLSNIIFLVTSVQLRYRAIDRLIHFTVCATCTASVARHFKQYYNSIGTIYTCNTNGMELR